MSRLVKIIDNKYVQIEEYRNPNICFNTNEYNNFEDYCTLRETFDPFEMFYENQELKKQLHEASIEMQEMIEQDIECPSNCSKLKDLDKIEKSFIEIKNQQKEFIEYLTSYIDLLSNKPDLIEEAEIDILEEILSKYKSIIGGKE